MGSCVCDVGILCGCGLWLILCVGGVVLVSG